MAKPPPPQGFMGLPDLGDLTKLIPGDITKLLPPQVTDAIKGTVGSILGDEPGTPNIGDPQPPGEPPIPVKPGTPHFAAAAKALDTAISAIDMLLKLSFVIPDQYESPLKALQGALKTIRGWLG
jgi:hypothetical protein